MDEDGAGGELGSGVVLAVPLALVVLLLAILSLAVGGVAVAVSGVAGVVASAARASLPRSTAARFSCVTVADSCEFN